MGEVYRATDSVLERTVAVKVLSERHARETEVRVRFEREALAAARLSRERHVVTVFDVGEHGGRPLIVMEFVEGGSVHDRLARGPIPREQALDWLDQVGQALDRAHASGIVHRDVKPANLLLDAEGHIRVTDFGIASAAGLDTLTLPGTVLGTAGYLSPEQARGEPATPASDRYSLGVIAFELLTGRRPFEGDTPATQAFAHVNAPVPSAEELAPSLPRGVDAVLARALAKEPSERPSTCAELVTDLRHAFRGAEEAASTDAGWPAPANVRETTARAPTTSVTRVLPRDRRRAPGSAALARAGALVARVRPHAVSSARQLLERPRARPRAAAALAAAGVLVVSLALAILVGAGNDTPNDGGSRSPTGSPPATTTTDEVAEPLSVDGAALNAEGFALMQDGRFERAQPILRQAVGALKGSGTLDEAYASFNLAFTRFALGSCTGVLGLLDRSERIQGERSEIDRLRAEWADGCAPADEDAEELDDVEAEDDDDGPGRSGSRGRGRGNGRGG